MRERPVELVEKAIEREDLHNQLLAICEQLIMCQGGHIKAALKLIEQNKIADAKHELENGRLHMQHAAEPLIQMKLRSILLDLWIRRNAVDVVTEEGVEQELSDVGVSKETIAELEKIFKDHA